MKSPALRKNGLQGLWGLILAIVAVGCMSVGCGDSGSSFKPNYNPPPPIFTNPMAIANTYLPLANLNQDILEGEEGGEAVRVERTRTHPARQDGPKTFTVNGQTVEVLVMEDREFINGELAEVTWDYFAQSDDGTVYYLGEDVDIYENGLVVSHEGAWLYGVHTDKLGILMPANPQIGDKFRAEDVPGITRENNEVVSLSETVTVPAGTYTNCLKIKEITGGEVEYKYYAPNVGVVKEEPEDGELNLKSHS
jgi:hypothetical protein